MIKKITKGKYYMYVNKSVYEIIKFPNGSWIMTDVKDPKVRFPMGEAGTLREAKEWLTSLENRVY